MNHLTELVITCGSWQEAQRAADALLEKQLVTSVETFETKQHHWWEGRGHHVQDVKVLVLCSDENIDQIKQMTDRLHRVKTAPVQLTQTIN